MLQVGDTFVLNCLGDQAGAIMKHFLQRFPPGAGTTAWAWLTLAWQPWRSTVPSGVVRAELCGRCTSGARSHS